MTIYRKKVLLQWRRNLKYDDLQKESFMHCHRNLQKESFMHCHRNHRNRRAQHANDPVLGRNSFETVYRTDSYAAQRGLEQTLHNLHNPPLNKINPISPNNPNITTYMNAASDFLGGVK